MDTKIGGQQYDHLPSRRSILLHSRSDGFQALIGALPHLEQKMSCLRKVFCGTVALFNLLFSLLCLHEHCPVWEVSGEWRYQTSKVGKRFY